MIFIFVHDITGMLCVIWGINRKLLIVDSTSGWKCIRKNRRRAIVPVAY